MAENPESKVVQINLAGGPVNITGASGPGAQPLIITGASGPGAQPLIITGGAGGTFVIEESAKTARRKNKRLSKDEANKIAMKLAERDSGFIMRSAPEWADQIGCSVGLVPTLPFWDKVMEETGRGRRKGPLQGKVVGISEAVESGAGEEDAELRRLIEEQAADFEESPLVPDSMSCRRKTRTHKRL